MKQHLVFAVAVGVTASFGLRAQDGAADPGMPTGETQSADRLSSGVKITYEPGQGITFTHGDVAELNVSGSIQAKLYFTDMDSDSPMGDQLSFQARRVRTNFEGFLWNRDITYRLQLDHTGGSSVLDAWGDWHLYNTDQGYVGTRLGLQKMGGSLQFATEGTGLEFTERSVATRTFSELRDLGMLVHGGFMNGEKDGDYKLHWFVGAMNNGNAAGAAGLGAGAPPGFIPDPAVASRAGLNADDQLMYNAGLWFSAEGIDSPESWTEGDLAHSGNASTLFGVQYMLGNQDYSLAYGGPAGMTKTSQAALSGAFKSGTGVAVQGEYFLRNDDNGAGDADSTGYYLQGSFTTQGGEDQTQYGIAARYGFVDLENGSTVAALPGTPGTVGLTAAGEISEIQIGLNAYYHAHHLKTQLVYTLQAMDMDAGGDMDNQALDLMFTLMF